MQDEWKTAKCPTCFVNAFNHQEALLLETAEKGFKWKAKSLLLV